MIVFAATTWLWAAGAAGVLGGVALWRGQRRERAVSSLRLWRGLTGTAGTPGRRRVDPLWVLVLLAAVLGAVAVARPAWRSSAAGVTGVQGVAGRGGMDVEWNVRSATQSPERGEAWVRVPKGWEDGDSLWINGVQHAAGAPQMQAGVVAEVVGNRAEVALQRRGETIAAAVFHRPVGGAVFSYARLGGGGMVDPELDHFFRMQSGARMDDPSVRPLAVLVAEGPESMADLTAAELIIGQPVAALPGVTPGPRVAAETGKSWTPQVAGAGDFAWPQFVSLNDVHVKAYATVQLSPEWQVVARVNGAPWIAVRRDHGFWVWLASLPATETDWSRAGAGFVAFFAEMQSRAFGSAGGPPWVEWKAELAPAKNVAFSLDLQPFAGVAAITLLISAVAWQLARRGRPGPSR